MDIDKIRNLSLTDAFQDAPDELRSQIERAVHNHIEDELISAAYHSSRTESRFAASQLLAIGLVRRETGKKMKHESGAVAATASEVEYEFEEEEPTLMEISRIQEIKEEPPSIQEIKEEPPSLVHMDTQLSAAGKDLDNSLGRRTVDTSAAVEPPESLDRHQFAEMAPLPDDLVDMVSEETMRHRRLRVEVGDPRKAKEMFPWLMNWADPQEDVPAFEQMRQIDTGARVAVCSVWPMLLVSRVDAVLEAWRRDSSVAHMPLHILGPNHFEMRGEAATDIPRAADEQRARQLWRAEDVRQLFLRHRHLAAVRLGYREKGGIIHTELVVVAYVFYKGYCLVDELPLPTVLFSLPMDVREGAVMPAVGASDLALYGSQHMDGAVHPGCSLGSDTENGTVGAVMFSNSSPNRAYAITAEHVVAKRAHLTCPSGQDLKRSWQTQTAVEYYVGFDGDFGKTSIDAAIVEIPPDSALLSDPTPGGSGFAISPPLDGFERGPKPIRFSNRNFVIGAPLDVQEKQDDWRFVILGRTSGVVGLGGENGNDECELVASLSATASRVMDIKLLRDVHSEKDGKRFSTPSHPYIGQLLFGTTFSHCGGKPGDSGSIVFALLPVDEARFIHPVALVHRVVCTATNDWYAVATPINSVLQWMDGAFHFQH